MERIKLKIIIGSTRVNRFSEKPAHWLFAEAKKRDDVDVELLDLREYPLPFFEEPTSPSSAKEPFTNPHVQTWTARVADGDAFLIVTPEYNHGYPAVLKNALDYVFKEWKGKPVGFVSYGSALGARSIEQLRQVVIELSMIPIRNSIHISSDIYRAVMNEKVPVDPKLFEPLKTPVDRVGAVLDELTRLARALKVRVSS